MSKRLENVAVVAIGRNEGERLRTCLRSVIDSVALVVYVDSASTDDSVALASSMGVEVVSLDMSIRFTAARARNTGWKRVRELAPHVQLVQFVDGDCEVQPGWLDAAVALLAERPDVGSVCGRRRERHPERSVYNRLCDIEWNTPLGERLACGGDAMIRVAALDAIGGFRDETLAGEEAEMYVRLRGAGWKIWRIDHEMTLHDAGMTRLSQWWMRTMRSGFGYAEGAALHGAPPERHKVRESRRALFWGAGLPIVTLVGAFALGPWALLAWLAYPLQALRLYLGASHLRQGRAAWAMFTLAAKFPEAAGVIKFAMLQRSGRSAHVNEFKYR